MIMKYIIILSYVFFLSEFVLMLLKRSKKSATKQRNDKGSLILLWVMITLCFTFGFIFANYHHWDFCNFIIVGFGLLIILIGFTIRWMAIIQLKKAFTVDVAIGTEQKLKTNGMYKYIRHPSYLGLLLIMIGFSICMNTIRSVIIIAIPMLLVLLYRISVEEEALIDAFGESYTSYKNRTKKIIPWVY
jgi:protein-S-isoprenylcysteine O-methyltransferase Ste14